MTRSFDVFFGLRLNKRFSKQSWGWWFEMPSYPLWRHCNEISHVLLSYLILSLGMGIISTDPPPVNEPGKQGSFCVCAQPMRRRYIVTLPPIGWAHTQNDPWVRHQYDNLTHLSHICKYIMILINIMTSRHGHVSLPLCKGNPPLTDGFVSQNTSEAVIWCFFCWHLEQAVESTFDLPAILCAMIFT